MDHNGTEFLHKARCNLREDLQHAHEDYDPEELYALVAANESIRIFIENEAPTNLHIEGGDVSNTYLDGDIDTKIIRKQPTDSSGLVANPG